MPRGIYQHKKGYKHTEKTKLKIGFAIKGKKRPHTKETRMKMSAKAKIRVLNGKHNFWKGGLCKINLKIRSSSEYKLWREAVFKRDNFTCVWCGRKGVYLNADHIKPFCDYPELRFAIDNGRTLCGPCHRKTDTYGINQFNHRRTMK